MATVINTLKARLRKAGGTIYCIRVVMGMLMEAMALPISAFVRITASEKRFLMLPSSQTLGKVHSLCSAKSEQLF
ncbi:hypothetical protein ORD21_16960 [Deinococcus sp. ZS9-10]|uniref:Uncharacterized protein n=1 Tax=Deinococcus arenicola TaxID=2994950 RepID=A0ABU4DV27_9DEIO|nr:hypothetical protein [Deinococcus sp. ZS9-10]